MSKTLRSIDFLAPIRTVSEMNVREHWAVRNKRKRAQQEAIAVAMQNVLQGRRIELPCVVRLTRLAPRKLDSHDNLRAALKATVDQICKKLEVDDGSDQVSFEYSQMPVASPKTYGVKVSISSLENSNVGETM